MGDVKKNLCKKELPERELHNSRMFIDLAENIHIHYREYRNIFSLQEYFEYAGIISKSTDDVRSYLCQNPSYEEGKYPTTIMIAGGKMRQRSFLKTSPKPNQSFYHNNHLTIELQEEYVTDEIHIHYRDFRIAMNRENFRVFAQGVSESLLELNMFESQNEYNREKHNDRMIKINEMNKNNTSTTELMGVTRIMLTEVKSNWYEIHGTDFISKGEIEWLPNRKAINILKKEYAKNRRFVPIILSTEKDGSHIIVDGHHRTYTALLLGLYRIDAIIINLPFKETGLIRNAESLLKKFDKKTNYKYGMSEYLRSFLGFKLNRYYAGSFNGKMKSMNFINKNIRKIKKKIFGKRSIFKNFNERKNK